MRVLTLLTMALGVFVFTSCNKASTDNRPGFDRHAFLTSYADNLILPFIVEGGPA